MLSFLATAGMRVRYRRRPDEVFTVLRRSIVNGRLVIVGTDKKELVVLAADVTEEVEPTKPEASKPDAKLETIKPEASSKPEANSKNSDENAEK